MNKRDRLIALTKATVLAAAICPYTGLYAQSGLQGAFSPMIGAPSRAIPANHRYFAYVGTYTGPNSKGICAYSFDTATAHFAPLGVAAEMQNPSFVISDPTHHHLYAVTEMGNGGDQHGSISSFTINRENGSLKFLNKVDSAGGGPCHLVVDATGKMLLVANYGTGSIASFAIKPDGSIGEKTAFDQYSGSSIDSRRQKGPHAHEVVLSADNRFLFVPDLGTGVVKIYRINPAKGTFEANNPAVAHVEAGLGPRHFIFGKGEKFAYVLCEMGSSVAVFSYDRTKGALTPVQTISNLPSDFKGEDNSAEIQVGPSGRFLYASNRGHDSITVYAIDPQKGTLTNVQIVPSNGKIPRNFVIDPSGKHLIVANQKSDNMVVFNIDPTTGKLAPAGEQVSVSSPVSILFVPASQRE